MMNKPKGVISATEDPKHRTVLDLLDDLARSKEVFPVGRLDIDTHGLLLLTNDGQLAHVLLSPKRHVDKTYLAQVKGIMTMVGYCGICFLVASFVKRVIIDCRIKGGIYERDSRIIY
ncbi:ribosomal small subunit pseudouridine synthase A [Streptococcus pneumoniae]|nr:ribosomal small subunit pseudouridine synthase A [Streptococcus pneumoniae]